jgi:hypothetical protein
MAKRRQDEFGRGAPDARIVAESRGIAAKHTSASETTRRASCAIENSSAYARPARARPAAATVMGEGGALTSGARRALCD